jgi:hypothetical protein
MNRAGHAIHRFRVIALVGNLRHHAILRQRDDDRKARNLRPAINGFNDQSMSIDLMAFETCREEPWQTNIR